MQTRLSDAKVRYRHGASYLNDVRRVVDRPLNLCPPVEPDVFIYTKLLLDENSSH